MPGYVPITRKEADEPQYTPTSALRALGNDYDAFESGTAGTPSGPATKSDTPTPDAPTKQSPNKAGAGFFNPPVSPEESVENTPEADPNHSSAEYHAIDTLRDLSGLYTQALTGKPQVTKTPSAQQNVNAALAPDQKALAALPSEYGQTMATISQYLTGSGAQSTGVPALDAADAQVNQTIEGQTPALEKALGGLASAGKEYGQSVLYQAPLASAISNIKYQQEIGELSVTHDDWPSTMTSIYDYLTGQGTAATGAGSGATASGLPSPASAANQADAAQAQTADTLAGGGNG